MRLNIKAICALVVLVLFCTYNDSIAQQYQTAKVVGRFYIKNPTKGYYRKKTKLIFSERYLKHFSCTFKKRDSGYFEIKLPLGYNYLERVEYYDAGEYVKKFSTGYLAIKLDSANRVYYVGDILLYWDITHQDARPDKTDVIIASVLLGGIGGTVANSIQSSKITKQNNAYGEAARMEVTYNPATIACICASLGIDKASIITSPLHPKQ